ncbi:HNH endonuclease [Alteromonas oceanisediminis]|uniref:HNH endonuclease n=1 Tax=Alteromonas oceanisediminis TaxID=2836180 RepID=UPI001BDA0DB8|nr:HNH endonuclease [Alteromonas oceanisediminis]MBT0585128.1 HNH endonuclease [Alteromonas oceanisediminis]
MNSPYELVLRLAGQKPVRKQYKTGPAAALKYAHGWLTKHQTKPGKSATLYSIHSATQRFEHAEEIPLPEKSSVDFYASQPWKKLAHDAIANRRKQCLQDGSVFSCALCFKAFGPGVQAHADHIKPRSLYPDLALDMSNIQILCSDCNLGKSNRDATDWR